MNCWNHFTSNKTRCLLIHLRACITLTQNMLTPYVLHNWGSVLHSASHRNHWIAILLYLLFIIYYLLGRFINWISSATSCSTNDNPQCDVSSDNLWWLESLLPLSVSLTNHAGLQNNNRIKRFIKISTGFPSEIAPSNKYFTNNESPTDIAHVEWIFNVPIKLQMTL